ncbi:uncharacterized protein LOC143213080 isoform X2 [Lasioglossum baleicum]|uniref:uncharacterized protein LOC143213080 isoform X2 n=1 Tax=Lasioglossum baleicum TaxID=434251 RepID=UPI003FCC419E
MANQQEGLEPLPGVRSQSSEDWSLYNELSFLEKSAFPLLKSPSMTLMPMLRARRRTRVIQRYPISATNGAPNEENETKIVATPIGETKQTAKEPRTSLAARGKRRATEDIGRKLRNTKIVKLNTTDNGTYSLPTAKKRIVLKKLKKRPKYLNVNIIHSSTPEDHRRPVTPVSTPSEPCHTLAQDECRCFGTYIANKTKSYSACTRSAVQHAISEILFKADRGHYDRANSSVTVHTQTEATQSNVQQWSDSVQLIYEVKSEELSDLDDEAISH